MGKLCMRQTQFKLPKAQKVFGGSLLKGNPKGKRPLATKRPIHLTLKAKTGGMRQPKVFGKIEATIQSTAKKYGVRVYRHINVGDHIHSVIKLTRRELWPAFIRELTSRIAGLAGIEWKFRPHARILEWGRDFKAACEYIYLNWLEAEGHINRRETKTLKDLKAILSG